MQGIFTLWLVWLSIAVAISSSCAAAWLAFRLGRRHPREADAREWTDTLAYRTGTHDSLTGLPNRHGLIEAAEPALRQARADGSQVALLMLHVDRLKQVNDSLGHEAGDALLRKLALRLRSLLRRRDTLAHLAGDEFTVLATQLQSAGDAETIIAKIYEALRGPFDIAGTSIHASLTIGISMFPPDGDTFDLLLRRADAAMNYTKDFTRGGYRFYAAEMSNFIDDQLALETELRRAIEIGELALYYQPKVDIPTGRVRSAEALIRWRHPQRGFVPPNVFIPVAEETGLIMAIGEWVLREACSQMRRWLDAGMAPIRIAVNLSARQFRHADLVELVQAALQDAQLQPGYLELELTESAVMHDAERSAATMQALSAMGVHVSIDDFGTGYSSLSYLRRFPLDKLKIDRSFIRDVLTNADDGSIVKAIISLAHNLRLRVVAEGVETAEQLEYLQDLGCDQYQGFLCSPAVPADQFAALLQRMRNELPEYAEADVLRTQSRLSAYAPAGSG